MLACAVHRHTPQCHDPLRVPALLPTGSELVRVNVISRSMIKTTANLSDEQTRDRLVWWKVGIEATGLPFFPGVDVICSIFR